MILTEPSGLPDHAPPRAPGDDRPDGSPQVHPVAFWVDPDGDLLEIGGPDLARSQKFRNVTADPRVSLVVDDQSATPNPLGQTGRGVELRGGIEIVRRDPPLAFGFSPETLLLRPHRIISWNIEAFDGSDRDGGSAHLQGYRSRDVARP